MAVCEGGAGRLGVDEGAGKGVWLGWGVDVWLGKGEALVRGDVTSVGIALGARATGEA